MSEGSEEGTLEVCESDLQEKIENLLESIGVKFHVYSK